MIACELKYKQIKKAKLKYKQLNLKLKISILKLLEYFWQREKLVFLIFSLSVYNDNNKHDIVHTYTSKECAFSTWDKSETWTTYKGWEDKQ